MAILLAGTYQPSCTAQGSRSGDGAARLPNASCPCHDGSSIQGRDHARVSGRARHLMAEDQTPPPSEGSSGNVSSSPGREALMVWVKLLGLLAGLALFCLVVFRLT